MDIKNTNITKAVSELRRAGFELARTEVYPDDTKFVRNITINTVREIGFIVLDSKDMLFNNAFCFESDDKLAAIMVKVLLSDPHWKTSLERIASGEAEIGQCMLMVCDRTNHEFPLTQLQDTNDEHNICIANLSYDGQLDIAGLIAGARRRIRKAEISDEADMYMLRRDIKRSFSNNMRQFKRELLAVELGHYVDQCCLPYEIYGLKHNIEMVDDDNPEDMHIIVTLSIGEQILRLQYHISLETRSDFDVLCKIYHKKVGQNASTPCLATHVAAFVSDVAQKGKLNVGTKAMRSARIYSAL